MKSFTAQKHSTEAYIIYIYNIYACAAGALGIIDQGPNPSRLAAPGFIPNRPGSGAQGEEGVDL